MGYGRPRGRLNGVDIKPGVIRQARIQAGLSLAQVAGTDLTRQAVHLIETGKVRPSLNSLRIVTDRVGVSIDSVLLNPEATVGVGRPVQELEALIKGQHYQLALERGQRLIDDAASSSGGALVHYYLGQALFHLGRPLEALNRLRKAREFFDADGNDRLAAESMDWEAQALHLAEDNHALSVAERALDRYRRADGRPPETEARLLEHLGTIHAGRGDFQAARACYGEALRTAGKVRDLARIARIYHGLSMCYFRIGDSTRAIDLMMKAETLYEAEQRINEAPPNLDLPRVENDLGMLLMYAGDFGRAEERFESALRRLTEMGVDRLRSYFLLSLGELRGLQGRHKDGLRVVEQAIEMAQRLGETRAMAEGYQQLGVLRAAIGDEELAVAAFQQSLVILEDAGLESRRAECLQAYEQAMIRVRAANAISGA